MVGSSQKSRNCVRTTMKDAQQITCQSSHTCTRDPDACTTIHQQETMTQHPHAVGDHGRRQHLTATDLRDLIRQSFPRPQVGSRVVNKCTVLLKTTIGMCGRALDCDQLRRGSTAWNTVDDQTVETPRTLHGVRAMRGILRHPVSGISDVDPHGTIGGHTACIATTGATKDEGQEEQCCESSGGSVGARQSLTERQPGNPVEEGAQRLRPSTEWYSKRRQRCDVLRTTRDVRESVAAHSPDHGGTGSRDEAEQSHSAQVHREATGRDRTPLLSARTREHDDAGHAVAESSLGMLDVQYNLRTQPGRVRCSTCRPGELRGCRPEHGSHWRRRDTVHLKVQGS